MTTELNIGEPVGRLLYTRAPKEFALAPKGWFIHAWARHDCVIPNIPNDVEQASYPIFSQDYVNQLLGEIEALKKQLEPDIFWDNEDHEQSWSSIADVVFQIYQNCELEVGDEIEIQQAVLMKNAKVKITKISDDGDIEWEIVNDSE